MTTVYSNNFEFYATNSYPFPSSPLPGWTAMTSQSGLQPAIVSPPVNASGNALNMNSIGGGATGWMSVSSPLLAGSTTNWSVSADARWLESNWTNAWYGFGGLLFSSTGDMSDDFLWLGPMPAQAGSNTTTISMGQGAEWRLGGTTGSASFTTNLFTMRADAGGPANLTVSRTNGSSGIDFVLLGPTNDSPRITNANTLSFSGAQATALNNLQYVGFANYLSEWQYDNLTVQAAPERSLLYSNNFGSYTPDSYPVPSNPLPGWSAMPSVYGVTPSIVTPAVGSGKALELVSFGGGATGWMLASPALLAGSASDWQVSAATKWTGSYLTNLPYYGVGGLLLSDNLPSDVLTGNWLWIGYSRGNYDDTGNSWSLPIMEYSLGGTNGSVALGGPAFRDFTNASPIPMSISRTGGSDTISLLIDSPLDGPVVRSNTFTGAQAAALNSLVYVGFANYYSDWEYDNLAVTGRPSAYFWTASSGDWSLTNSWLNNAAAKNGGVVNFSGAGGASTNNQLNSVNGLAFNNGAGSYILSGTNLNIGSAGIANNSGNLQTVSNNLILSTPLTVSSASGALVLAGNTTNVGHAITFSNAAAAAMTNSGVISGSGSVVKTGAGTLTLSGNNTYSGGTLVSQGILQIGNGGTSGSLAGSITNNAGLVFNRSDNLTQSNAISGSGSVVKTGAGTLTLSGNNTYSGGTTLSSGVLRAAHAGALGTGVLQASSGTTLEVTNGITVSNNLSVYTVKFLNGGNTLSGTITNNNTVYDVTNGTTNTLSGFLTGSGGVELIGGGVLAITGTTNNYTGHTVISNGTVRIGTLANSNTTGPLGVSNNVTLAGTAAGTNANSGTTAVLDYTGDNVTTDRAFVLNNGGGTINMATAANEMTLTGSASGSGKLIVGEGTLVLSNTGASNSFAPGSIQVDSGATLQLAANNQIGDSSGLILNGGTFRVGTSTSQFSETLGTLTLSASSTIDLGAWTGGTKPRQIVFDNSSAIVWTGTLTITNWQGVARQSSDVAEILFGAGGLTSTQLGQISFANQNINGGALLDSGELVPIPEARIVWAALALALFIVWRERRRWLAFVAHARSQTEFSSGATFLSRREGVSHALYKNIETKNANPPMILRGTRVTCQHSQTHHHENNPPKQTPWPRACAGRHPPRRSPQCRLVAAIHRLLE